MNHIQHRQEDCPYCSSQHNNGNEFICHQSESPRSEYSGVLKFPQDNNLW